MKVKNKEHLFYCKVNYNDGTIEEANNVFELITGTVKNGCIQSVTQETPTKEEEVLVKDRNTGLYLLMPHPESLQEKFLTICTEK